MSVGLGRSVIDDIKSLSIRRVHGGEGSHPSSFYFCLLSVDPSGRRNPLPDPKGAVVDFSQMSPLIRLFNGVGGCGKFVPHTRPFVYIDLQNTPKSIS